MNNNRLQGSLKNVHKGKQLLVFLIAAMLLQSGLFVNAIEGGDASAFLSYGGNARSLAMGGAFVGLANDASAAYWNPAALTQIKAFQSSFLVTPLYDFYTYSAYNFAVPMVDQSIGLSIVSLMSKDMEKRDAYNINTGSFQDSRLSIGLSAGKVILPAVSLGFSGKYITRTLDTNSDSRIVGDFGLLYTPLSFLSIGFTFKNIMDFQLDQNSKDKFATVMRAGIAYKIRNLNIAVDVEDNMNQWFLGVEYLLHPMVILRAGMSYYSVGFGVGVNVGDINFDYCYSTDELGANHRFSLNLGIGSIISGAQNSKAMEWYDGSIRKYQSGFFLLALEEMRKAYNLFPENEEIQKRLQKLEKLENLSEKLDLDINREKTAWQLYELARKAVIEKRMSDAIEITKKALKIYPQNAFLSSYLDQLTK